MELCPLFFVLPISPVLCQRTTLCYCTISPESKITLCTFNISQDEHHLTEPPGVVGLEGVRGLEVVRGMTNRSTMRTALIGSRPDTALHLLGNFLV